MISGKTMDCHTVSDPLPPTPPHNTHNGGTEAMLETMPATVITLSVGSSYTMDNVAMSNGCPCQLATFGATVQGHGYR